MPKYHYKFTGNLKGDTRMIKEFSKHCVDTAWVDAELSWIRREYNQIIDASVGKKYWYQQKVGYTAVISEEKPEDTIPFTVSKMYIGEL